MSKRAWTLMRTLASLRLAVVVLGALAVVLAAATIVESRFGSDAARRYVYGAVWFSLVLLLLGVNVAAATIIRWPWRPRHVGFVITHIGILVVLGGCLATNLLGINGRLALQQGMQDNRLVQEDWVIRAATDPAGKSEAIVPIGQPPRVGLTRQFRLAGRGFQLQVLRYLPDVQVGQQAVEGSASDPAAVQVEVHAGEHVWQQWLVVDDTGAWSIREPGFSLLALSQYTPPKGGDAEGLLVAIVPGQDRLTLIEQDGGQVLQQTDLPLDTPITLKKMTMTIVARLYLPHARTNTVVVPRPAGQGGDPQPAVQVELTRGDWQQSAWLLWAQATRLGGGPDKIDVTLQAREVEIPFTIRLNRFDIEEYPGTGRPAMFRSNVTVIDPRHREERTVDIEMNRPLEYDGWSFFQNSYSMEGSQRMSVLAVSKDPGQAVVFWGATLLVVGTMVLAIQRLVQQGKSTKAIGGPTRGHPAARATTFAETDHA